ncbi:response regulator [Pelagibaculum spongiae]|nr:response regulator [Pelagibaculum spongiae]
MYLLRVIVSCLLLLLALSVQAQPSVVNGQIDLSNWDFQTDPIKLDGMWQAASNKLLTPQDTFPDQYLPVPKIWGEIGLPDHGYVSYRLIIQLPENAPPLILESPTQYTAWRLWANDQLMANVGTPGKNAQSNIPKLQERLIRLPQTQRLELVWQIANFQFYSGGPKRSLTLGSAEQLQASYNQRYAFLLMNLGGYLLLGLYFLALYVVHPKEYQLLTLAWASLIIIGQVFIGHKIEGNWLVDNFDYYVVDIIEWTSAWMFPPTYLLILHQLYKGYYRPAVVYSLFAFSVIFSALSFSSYLNESFIFINIGLAMMPISLIYGSWGLTLAYKNEVRGSIYSLIISGLVIFSVVHDEYRAVTGEFYPSLTAYAIAFWFLVNALTIGDRSQQKLKAQTYRSKKLDQLLLKKNQQLQSQLAELQKTKEGLTRENSAKSNFLGILSHELRTPVNGIKAISHALQHTHLDKQQQQLVSSAKSATNTLTILIDQLLDQSQIIDNQISFHYSSFNLKQLLQDTICLLHYQADLKNVMIDLELINLPEHLIADKNRLQLVFISCINYLIKHSEKGSILISARAEALPDSQWKIEITARSNNIKMSEHKLSDSFLFDLNNPQSDNYLSSGFGLNISQQIIDAMKGKIWLETISDNAGCLKINIKLGQGEASIQSRLKPKQPATIMVVDDDPLNHQVIKMLLPCDQFRIITANSGEQALNLLNDNIDLLLVDIQMSPMNGLELAEVIRALPEQELASLPMYAYTASLMPQQLDQYQPLFDGILRKPVHHEALFNIINQHTQSSPEIEVA